MSEFTEADRQALVDERNHWIGEAKRYERLYRMRDKDARRWYQRMKEAEAKVGSDR